MVVATATSSYQNHTFLSNFLSSSPNNSNLFPLHLCWLKRQSVTSFYPFFVCVSFLFIASTVCFGDFGRYGPTRLESVRVGAYCESKKKKRMRFDAQAVASLAHCCVGSSWTWVRRPFCRVHASQSIPMVSL